MAAGLLIFPGAQPSRSRDGGIIAAELRWYQNETTLPAVVYQDQALSVPHAFPIVSDDFGRFPLIWADTGNAYSVNWSTAAPDSQSSSYDGLTSTTAADIALLDQMNALVAQAEDIYDNIVEANTGFSATSATELTVDLGTKTLLTQSGKSLINGTLLKFTVHDNTDIWIYGPVTDYDPTSGQLQLDAELVQGAGTYDNWDISPSGPRGATGSLSADNSATAAELRAATATDKFVSPATFATGFAYVDLGDVSGTVTLNLKAGFNFKMRLVGNVTLADPTNKYDGWSGTIVYLQSSGGHTLSVASAIDYPGLAPTLSTTGGARDRQGAICEGTLFTLTNLEKGIA